MNAINRIIQKKWLKCSLAILIGSLAPVIFASTIPHPHHHRVHHPALAKSHAQRHTLTDLPQVQGLGLTAHAAMTAPASERLAAINLLQLTHPPTVAASNIAITATAMDMAPHAATPAQKHLINFVDQTVYNLRYSRYRLGGERFDPSSGIYVLDCSRFVDHVLSNTYPTAYMNLVNASGAPQPATQHFYDFFHEIANDSDNSHYWQPIEQINQLRPGDILVFRNKHNRSHHANGHVVVVMDQPVRTATQAFAVRVADSAVARHSADTRQAHESGIGIGTLLLKPNPHTGKPTAYAWEMGGAWRHNVNFAMARPLRVAV